MIQIHGKLMKIILFVAILPVYSNSFAKVIFKGDFETGTPQSSGAAINGLSKHECCPYSLAVINGIRRGGENGLKALINKDDPWGINGAPGLPRAQLYKGTGAGREFVLGKEYWVGFSIYIPNNWVNDPSPESIVDWHMRPDVGEKGTTSSLRLSIIDKKMRIKVSWDSRPLLSLPIEGQKFVWDGPLEKGKWVDWVFKIKFSYNADGIVKIWKDGNVIIDRIGPNAYNDVVGPYLKFGVYKWEWVQNPTNSITTRREIYFDEIRIGDANSSYSEVKPRGIPVTETGTQPPTPPLSSKPLQPFTPSISR